MPGNMHTLYHDHIAPSPYHKLLSRALGTVSHVYVAAYKWKKRNLKTGLTVTFNRNLSAMRRFPLRFMRDLPHFTTKQTQKWYPLVKRMHLRYVRLYSSLEKANFLNNTNTRRIADEVSDLFYRAEQMYRRKAFAETPSDENDRHLTEFASALSLNSLHQTNGL